MMDWVRRLRDRLEEAEANGETQVDLLDLPVPPADEDTLAQILQRLDSLEEQLAEKERRDGWEKYHDPLTGLYNERKLDSYMSELGTSWLVYCDLNAFKKYQDRTSHKAGDRVLIKFARFLDSICRRGGDRRTILRSGERRTIEQKDVVFKRLPARLHGDEFAIVCKSEEGAKAVCERIRRWKHSTVTASTGYGPSKEEADAGMYKYKRALKTRKRRKAYLLVGTLALAISIYRNAGILSWVFLQLTIL